MSAFSSVISYTTAGLCSALLMVSTAASANTIPLQEQVLADMSMAQANTSNQQDQKLQQSQREPMQLKTDTGKIHGVLELPAAAVAKSPVPLAILIAGSGPTDRNGNNPQMKNNSLKYLAQELNTKGIATLRYDKRGVGKSAGAAIKETDLRFEHFIEDAQAWVDLLHEDSRFSEIYVIGHSEGALIGAVVAQSPKVDGYVSLAGAGQPAQDVLASQLKAQPKMVWDAAEPVLKALAQGKTVKNPPFMLQALFRPSIQPYLISWFQYDPRTVVQKLAQMHKPVLIMQGDQDIQVSVKDAQNLAKANPEAKLVIMPGMNHIFKAVPAGDRNANIASYNQPDTPLISGLSTQISQFILKK